MAMTNDNDLAELMRLDRSHGITREPDMLELQDSGPWYYEQQRLGFNYRMTDMNAALGLSQIDRLSGFIGRRREIADIYDSGFVGVPVTTPSQRPDVASAWHLYVVRIKKQRAGHGHREVFEKLRNEGIGVNLHYIPVYLQPYYRTMGFAPGLCPNAEAYYSEAISLPMFPAMTTEQQKTVIRAVADAVSA